MQRLALVSLAFLAACGTPQDQCIARETRELRSLDRLIAETQGNLDRGYAIDRVTVYEDYWTWCEVRDPAHGGTVARRFCLDQRAVGVDQPRAIDPEAEARKLAGLKEQRRDLARAAEPAIAACNAAYPE
jgi:hypothetical protein